MNEFPHQIVDARPTATVAHGKDEMNLAEFPLTVLADRAPQNATTLEFHDRHGKLTITGPEAVGGLPTALDADVIVALIQITKRRNNFTQPTVNFTRYEIIQVLGWPNEGKSYRRIDQSLNRWVGVTLYFDGCWWDNRAKRHGDAKIHILESVFIFDGKARCPEEPDQQPLPLSSFTWNKAFLESCQANNLKNLNVETYFSLKHSTSKRLYRFLDKRLYRLDELAFDLEELAFDRVGLSRSYSKKVGKIKEKLQPAIAELEERGFLKPLDKSERYYKEKKRWKIRFIRDLARPDAEQPATTDDDPSKSGIEAALVERGVTRTTAVKLARQHPEAAIEERIEVFDWLAERKDKRISDNPPGYLRRSIQEGYEAPAGFVPRAERERAASEAEAARRHAEATREAERMQQAQAEAKEANQRLRRAAYWGSLSPEDQAAMRAEAMQASGEAASVVARLRRQKLNHFAEAQERQILDDYIDARLAEQDG